MLEQGFGVEATNRTASPQPACPQAVRFVCVHVRVVRSVCRSFNHIATKQTQETCSYPGIYSRMIKNIDVKAEAKEYDRLQKAILALWTATHPTRRHTLVTQRGWYPTGRPISTNQPRHTVLCTDDTRDKTKDETTGERPANE